MKVIVKVSIDDKIINTKNKIVKNKMSKSFFERPLFTFREEWDI